ncbi:MAG TPA: glycosyltransferase family 39 protein [Candidatus Eisenbacteria bacterium]|nr:glycosyltransferase family 39 protein [Candidatus Eisenbacteria bacterium]
MIRHGALLAALFLVPCGALGVVETTEARYAEIAREMVVTRDFLIPHLDGLPHLDKPPGAYWAIAPGVLLFGHNEWGARISVVLAALLTLAFTARIAFLTGGNGARASWILAASPLFFVLFHLASADPFLTTAVAGFHAAYVDERRRGGLLPFVALGLGLFIKGPVVFVPTLLPLIGAAWWTRSRRALRPLGNVVGWLVTLVLGLAWYVYIVLRVPGLAAYLLGHELWHRFATTEHHRGGPPYYFVALLIVGVLPWTWATIRGLIARLRARADFERTVVAAWVVLPLLFFSLSGSKLPGYVLPLTPALAIAAAWALEGARWPREAAPALVALFAVVPWFFSGQDEKAGSVRPVARYLRREALASQRIYECGPFVAGLPYYLGREVLLYQVQRDVRFATPEEREAIIRDAIEVPPSSSPDSASWAFGDERLAQSTGQSTDLRMRWRKSVLLRGFSEP